MTGRFLSQAIPTKGLWSSPQSADRSLCLWLRIVPATRLAVSSFSCPPLLQQSTFPACHSNHANFL